MLKRVFCSVDPDYPSPAKLTPVNPSETSHSRSATAFPNTFRRSVLDGERLVACWCSLANPITTEILGLAGLTGCCSTPNTRPMTCSRSSRNSWQGALLIGPRHSIGAQAENWNRTLSTFEIDLKRDGTVADHGCATNVLGGPVSELRHLVDILA
jgi:hypothetical protein